MKPPVEAQADRAAVLRAALVTDTSRTRRFGRAPGAALRVLSDTRLARLASKGDRAAFGVIFDRYHQQLYRYCLSIVRDGADAADAVQTTMLRALRALEGDRREIALRPWLYRIAFNESITLLRQRPSAGVMADLSVAAGLDVHADVELRERFDELVADLQTLPDRQRGALAMRELAGLDYDEIASALEISHASAKQAIYDARRTLHELARGREMSCDVIRVALADGDGRALRGRAVRAHLRACQECRELNASTERRRNGLAALAPAMPAATVKRVLGGLGLAGGGGAAAEGGLLAVAGLPVVAKALAAVVAGIGVTAGAAAVGGPDVAPAQVPRAAADRPGDRERARLKPERTRRQVHTRRGADRQPAGRTTRADRPAAPGPQAKTLERRTTFVTSAPTPHSDRAPQPPAPDPAPAAGSSPPRPTPVRDAMPPREDPGPIRTTVAVVGTTTATTVDNTRDAVDEALPQLPKRGPRP
jgi:RNA polymerase sigma factor (sigma-70 family)